MDRRRILCLAILMGGLWLLLGTPARAEEAPVPPAPPVNPPALAPAGGEGLVPAIPGIERARDPRQVVTTIEVLLLLTVLTLAPAIVVLTTSFTRIVIVLSFVRRALATQELPPNQVVIGLSLILSFLVMTPTLARIKQDALDPYLSTDPDAQIPQEAAFRRAKLHMRQFMFGQTRPKDIALFMSVARQGRPLPPHERLTRFDIPTGVLIPAFVISEMRRAFVMGFAIFLPFLVIDLVVSSTLISMGMLVLPPILVSLPIKILLFVLVDGWHLVVGSLVQSFVT